MNKTLTASPVDSTAQAEAIVEQYLADIDRLREQMACDQVEIDRSRARTQTMLDDLERMLKRTPQKAS